jgi:hypothetical protein
VTIFVPPAVNANNPATTRGRSSFSVPSHACPTLPRFVLNENERRRFAGRVLDMSPTDLPHPIRQHHLHIPLTHTKPDLSDKLKQYKTTPFVSRGRYGSLHKHKTHTCTCTCTSSQYLQALQSKQRALQSGRLK